MQLTLTAADKKQLMTSLSTVVLEKTDDSEVALRTLKNYAARDGSRGAMADIVPMMETMIVNPKPGLEDLVFSLAANLALEPKFCEPLTTQPILKAAVTFCEHATSTAGVDFLINILRFSESRHALVALGIIPVLQSVMPREPRSWILLFTLTWEPWSHLRAETA